MKILLMTVLFGCIILFFPLPVGNSSCLFGNITGICLYDHACKMGDNHMLNHYMHHFAIFWWGSIGLVAWLIYQWKKNRKGNHNAS